MLPILDQNSHSEISKGSWHRVYICIWKDINFKALSDDGKLLFFYFLTSPHSNCIGAYKLPMGYILEDLGWKKRRFQHAFSEFFSQKTNISCTENGKKFLKPCENWIEFDTEHDILFIKNFLDYNPICNQNSLKKAEKDLKELPDTPLLRNVILRLIEINNNFNHPVERFSERLAERLGEPLPERLGKHTYTVDSIRRSNKEKVKKEKPRKTKKSIPSDLVEKIYSAYPKKSSAEYSKKKITAAIEDISAEKKISPEEAAAWLTGTVRKYADSSHVVEQKRDALAKNFNATHFIPNCSTWMNQKNYNDPPEAWGYQNQSAPQSWQAPESLGEEKTVLFFDTLRDRIGGLEFYRLYTPDGFRIKKLDASNKSMICEAKDENLRRATKDHLPIMAGIISDILRSETSVSIVAGN